MVRETNIIIQHTSIVHSSLWVKLLFLFLFSSNSFSQTAPTEGLHEHTPRVFYLKHATLIPEPGKIVEDGEIVIRDGLIESVGRVANVPADAFEIDMTGKTIYAGFVEPFLEAETDEFDGNLNILRNWNEKVHPELSSLDDYSPDEKDLKELRALGFTTAHIVPPSGIFQGQSGLIHLGEWSVSSVIERNGPAQIMSFKHGGWGDSSYPNSLLGAIALIRQTFIDASWYKKSWETYRRFPNENEQPNLDESLAKLGKFLDSDRPFCFRTNNELTALRAGKISDEFSLPLWLKGSGYEYRRLDAIKKVNPFIILPVNYPETPDVSSWESALQYTNAQLRHWDQAPDNAQRLRQAGISFAFTSADLNELKHFRPNLRRSVERGLSRNHALSALTTVPAEQLGIADRLGTLEPGKIANLTITNGDYFESNTKVMEVWIQGEQFRLQPKPEEDIRGKWLIHWEVDNEIHIDSLHFSGKNMETSLIAVAGDSPFEYRNDNLLSSTGQLKDLRVSGSLLVSGSSVVEGQFVSDTTKISFDSFVLEHGFVNFRFEGKDIDFPGQIRFSGTVEDGYMEGRAVSADGTVITWYARLKHAPEYSPEEESEISLETASKLTPLSPEGAFGLDASPEQPRLVLVKNATLWTCGPDGIMEESDILVRDGKIWKIGRNLKITGSTKNAVIIDARGKHVTPGIIDCHSHSAANSINEGTQAVTSEVRIQDVLNPNDINIYRELAGGLTIANILHGSANPIGGQNAVIKLRWGSESEELLFENAPPGIKFALGENVKQSNWGDNHTTRYPQTRMGVDQIIRDSFTAAQKYKREWDEYKSGKSGALKKIPPRRDLELEALVEILEGKRLLHCHSYRQDEILMMMRIAEDFGFRIATFQHVLEGYKVAEILAEHGAGASTFTDWWAYKYEVMEAIPYNGALMQKIGVVTSYNSDSSELARRMNSEAAKAVKYGGLSQEDALKMVTINPAIQLGIDKWVGSLEKGKDADFVIWSGNPLSTYTVCEHTWIDGKEYFNIVKDRQRRKEMERERNLMFQNILNSSEADK